MIIPLKPTKTPLDQPEISSILLFPSSVVDPDSNWIPIQDLCESGSVLRIRISTGATVFFQLKKLVQLYSSYSLCLLTVMNYMKRLEHKKLHFNKTINIQHIFYQRIFQTLRRCLAFTRTYKVENGPPRFFQTYLAPLRLREKKYLGNRKCNETERTR